MKLKESIIKVLKILYSYFPLKYDYLSELKRVLKDCKTVLDLGCGENSPLQYISKDIYSVGVELFEPWIKKSRKRRIHNKYYKSDVLEINKLFENNSFDCVITLDLIEHLKKQDGYELIKLMEKIAKNKIIIFTTNGFIAQGELEENPWEVHKSGWYVEEMREMGYDVIGINGFKFLIGEFGLIKPKFFWAPIAIISQLFLRNHPKKTGQILCVKIK